LKDEDMREMEEVIKVSNPWREAIEGEVCEIIFAVLKSFQSLEGGY